MTTMCAENTQNDTGGFATRLKALALQVQSNLKAFVLPFTQPRAGNSRPASGPHSSPMREAIMHSLDCDPLRSVLLVGTPLGEMAKPADWLAAQSLQITWASRADWVKLVLKRRHAYSHVMLNIDHLGGINTIFDALAHLRIEVPDLPIILLSSSFARNNFNLDRIWLCDVSLRAPVTFAALELAMTTSELNNAVWQTRCSDGQIGVPHLRLVASRD
jgi:hypothetical protein